MQNSQLQSTSKLTLYDIYRNYFCSEAVKQQEQNKQLIEQQKYEEIEKIKKETYDKHFQQLPVSERLEILLRKINCKCAAKKDFKKLFELFLDQTEINKKHKAKYKNKCKEYKSNIDTLKDENRSLQNKVMFMMQRISEIEGTTQNAFEKFQNMKFELYQNSIELEQSLQKQKDLQIIYEKKCKEYDLQEENIQILKQKINILNEQQLLQEEKIIQQEKTIKQITPQRINTEKSLIQSNFNITNSNPYLSPQLKNNNINNNLINTQDFSNKNFQKNTLQSSSKINKNTEVNDLQKDYTKIQQLQKEKDKILEQSIKSRSRSPNPSKISQKNSFYLQKSERSPPKLQNKQRKNNYSYDNNGSQSLQQFQNQNLKNNYKQQRQPSLSLKQEIMSTPDNKSISDENYQINQSQQQQNTENINFSTLKSQQKMNMKSEKQILDEMKQKFVDDKTNFESQRKQFHKEIQGVRNSLENQNLQISNIKNKKQNQNQNQNYHHSHQKSVNFNENNNKYNLYVQSKQEESLNLPLQQQQQQFQQNYTDYVKEDDQEYQQQQYYQQQFQNSDEHSELQKYLNFQPVKNEPNYYSNILDETNQLQKQSDQYYQTKLKKEEFNLESQKQRLEKIEQQLKQFEQKQY